MLCADPQMKHWVTKPPQLTSKIAKLTTYEMRSEIFDIIGLRRSHALASFHGTGLRPRTRTCIAVSKSIVIKFYTMPTEAIGPRLVSKGAVDNVPHTEDHNVRAVCVGSRSNSLL